MAQVVVTTTQLPDAFIGVPYDAALAITGISVAGNCALAAGTTQTNKDALPAGLAYVGGRIHGTPTGPAISANLSIKASNSAGTDTPADNQAFTLNVSWPSASSAAAGDANANHELPLAVALSRTGLGGTE